MTSGNDQDIRSAGLGYERAGVGKLPRERARVGQLRVHMADRAGAVAAVHGTACCPGVVHAGHRSPPRGRMATISKIDLTDTACLGSGSRTALKPSRQRIGLPLFGIADECFSSGRASHQALGSRLRPWRCEHWPCGFTVPLSVLDAMVGHAHG
jgi:hypothetical protein